MAGGEGSTLYVVGAGSGDPGQVTPEAAAVIGACGAVAAGRHLISLAPDAARTHVIGADLDEARRFISSSLRDGDTCVLTSGDPGCYSILPFLEREFPGRITVIPGISSMQTLAARLRQSWHGWELVSVHGRGAGISVRPPTRPTIFFCDRENAPSSLARQLLERMGDCPAAAAADLGTPGEKLVSGTLRDIAASRLSGNSLLLLRQAAPARGPVAPGIPDEEWAREEGIPMSRCEVRSVLLGKAQPARRGVIWDVGAGTGSYGIECSLLAPATRVISIDKKSEAVDLVQRNAHRFGARIETVQGEAPACLKGLEPPDLVIIGGNDGRLDEIFTAALEALRPGGRLVVTAVLERTRSAAHRLFAGSGLAGRAATRVNIARGSKTEWIEQNPVIIFIGDKDAPGGDDG